MIHQLEKDLAEHGAALPADARAKATVVFAHAAMDGSDLDKLTKATDRMAKSAIASEQAVHMSQHPPQGAAGRPKAGAAASPQKPAVDAEFEEVTDRKRSA